MVVPAVLVLVGSRPPSPPKLQGDATWPPNTRRAPGFVLTDQTGHRRSLQSLRGHTVLLTFLYSHCRELCPTVGAELTQLQRRLPPAQRPVLAIVSTDPHGDTADSVRAFAANEAWTAPWYWFMGSQSQLAPVWRAYGIEVKPRQADVLHSGAIYLIDRSGFERSGYIAPFLLQGVSSDLRALGQRPQPSGWPWAIVAAVAFALAALAVYHSRWLASRIRRRRSRISLAAAILLAAAIAAWYGLLQPAAGAPRTPVGALIPPRARPAVQSLRGGEILIPPSVNLAADRGRIVFLNFWASWCVPCRQEAPQIARFITTLNPKTVRFVGVDVTDQRPAALAFIHRYRLNYPMLADPHGTLSGRFGLLGLPTTIVIDPTGHEAVRLLGPQTVATFQGVLRRLQREDATRHHQTT